MQNIAIAALCSFAAGVAVTAIYGQRAKAAILADRDALIARMTELEKSVATKVKKVAGKK